jgi:hypothetical protein
MAQTNSQTNNASIKPITLTIMPQAPAVRNNIPIPNFNHVPVQPVIVPPPAYTIGQARTSQPLPQNATEQDKLERQRLLNREKQRRFKEKTKGFVDLAHLPNIHERIKQLWLLTYPNSYDNVDPSMIDNAISRFVASMCTLTLNHRTG